MDLRERREILSLSKCNKNYKPKEQPQQQHLKFLPRCLRLDITWTKCRTRKLVSSTSTSHLIGIGCTGSGYTCCTATTTLLQKQKNPQQQHYRQQQNGPPIFISLKKVFSHMTPEEEEEEEKDEGCGCCGDKMGARCCCCCCTCGRKKLLYGGISKKLTEVLKHILIVNN